MNAMTGPESLELTRQLRSLTDRMLQIQRENASAMFILELNARRLDTMIADTRDLSALVDAIPSLP